jgi:hypothetical protein
LAYNRHKVPFLLVSATGKLLVDDGRGVPGTSSVEDPAPDLFGRIRILALLNDPISTCV